MSTSYGAQKPSFGAGDPRPPPASPRIGRSLASAAGVLMVLLAFFGAAGFWVASRAPRDPQPSVLTFPHIRAPFVALTLYGAWGEVYQSADEVGLVSWEGATIEITRESYQWSEPATAREILDSWGDALRKSPEIGDSVDSCASEAPRTVGGLAGAEACFCYSLSGEAGRTGSSWCVVWWVARAAGHLYTWQGEGDLTSLLSIQAALRSMEQSATWRR